MLILHKADLPEILSESKDLHFISNSFMLIAVLCVCVRSKSRNANKISGGEAIFSNKRFAFRVFLINYLILHSSDGESFLLEEEVSLKLYVGKLWAQLFPLIPLILKFFLLLLLADSNDLKIMHNKNSLSTVHSHFITKNSTRVISQRGGLAILPCSVTMTQPATVSKYLYYLNPIRNNPERTDGGVRKVLNEHDKKASPIDKIQLAFRRGNFGYY